MIKIGRIILTSLAISIVTLGISACNRHKTPAEDAGREIDQKVDQANKKINSAVDKVGDTIDEAGQKIEKVGHKVKDSVKK